MIIQQKNNEILIRFQSGARTEKIQSILDYLRYEELTSKSTVSGEDLNNLVNEAKAGRWNRYKDDIGLNE